jgi:pyrroline-5-carboxylate reductase
MSRRVAFLGGGKMAEALISGLTRGGGRKADELMVTCRREERARELQDRYGVSATLSNPEAVAWAETIVLTVKPQDMDRLCGQIRDDVRADHLVVSFAAGIRTAFIERRMAVAEELLASVGKVIRLPEQHLDAVTATSGSGPAYFFLLAEAMIEACILLGLPRNVATDLIVQTMVGSAKMLRDTGQHPVELREMVTSPGGTTIAAIRELEQAGVRAAFLNAIDAAAKRSAELAKGEDDEDID